VNLSFERIRGDAVAFLDRTRKIGWIDVLVIAGVVGLTLGLVNLAGEWRSPHVPPKQFDLSPSALPLYTFYSLMRGLLAYVLSLAFTLVYGYWAAKDKLAQRLLIPLLDILQSIPVLGFLPGLVISLNAIFPSNTGLEIAAIIMIFTGQAWNMTFSFYHSLRSIPGDQREAAAVYRFSPWQTLKWVELPFSTMGLVWNSMMSMAGGWFFLMINEAFQLGDNDYRLPGLGSYMSFAQEKDDYAAMAYGVFAMILMIVLLDQFFWRPVVVWAQRFRVEEGGYQETMHSWFLEWLQRSKLVGAMTRTVRNLFSRKESPVARAPAGPNYHSGGLLVARGLFALLLGVLLYGTWQLVELLKNVPIEEWLSISFAGIVTLGRVLISTALGTLWALPAGLAIGLSPRLSRFFQPIVQVAASFPAPMVFPIVVVVMSAIGIDVNWFSIALMLMGTQWYILFNVIAGAMAIPADLKESSRSFNVRGMQRFWVLYAPSVFPYLVTGWVTAAGGAWNASIVSEYVKTKSREYIATGIGAKISVATAHANFSVMAASIVVMSAMVVLFNRLIWRRLYHIAEERYSLNK